MAGTVIIFALLHIILSVIILVLMKLGILKVPGSFAAILIFVPIWGELCVLACHLLKITGHGGSRAIGVERLEADEEIYKSITMETETDKTVIPLEEALLLNGPEVKRSMIMNVLSDHPGDYLTLLKQAGKNEDVEVVHYATTAMSELSKEYDLKLQSLEARYSNSPDNREVLKEYADFLESYIDKEMARGQFLMMQRIQFGVLLQKEIDISPACELYAKKTENELEMENYEEAERLLSIMEEQWPEREEVWLLAIRNYAQQERGDKIKEILNKIRDKHIFLTSEGKKTVDFWKKGGEGLTYE